MIVDRAAWWHEMKEQANTSPFYRLLDMHVEEVAEGYARLRLPVGERLLQLYGVVHGGVAATLADSCVGVALISLLEPPLSSTTVEMKVNYLAPVTHGELVAEGRIVHKGRTLALGEADVRDHNGRLIAKALATYMILPGKSAETGNS